MEYGIFTSHKNETAQTRLWSLCLSCSSGKSILSAELYNGVDDDKILLAIVRRDNKSNSTLYAYKAPDGQIFTNDTDSVCSLIGKKLHSDVLRATKKDSIQLCQPYEMPTASEKGIKYCLKHWRMGTFCNYWSHNGGGMQFQLVTNKVEYVFMIQNQNCNIYCGASVNVPLDDGMLGAGQYFRIRNYGDNSQPFCRFECDFERQMVLPNAVSAICEAGACTVTKQGLYWSLKDYNDDMIVLNGCGGDEYKYRRNNANRSEYFSSEL